MLSAVQKSPENHFQSWYDSTKELNLSLATAKWIDKLLVFNEGKQFFDGLIFFRMPSTNLTVFIAVLNIGSCLNTNMKSGFTGILSLSRSLEGN